jgi:hypothetical protein
LAVIPAQSLPVLLKDRLTTLYNLISFCYSGSIGILPLQPLPKDIERAGMAVLFHLGRMLARDTALCYGADSAIAQFEKIEKHMRKPGMNGISKLFHTQRQVNNDEKFIPLADWPDYINTPLEESAVGRVNFVANMNYLLKWAGVPELTQKELI